MVFRLFFGYAFWGMCGTSSGENFGYLDKVDSSGNHYIGYYSTNEPEHVYLVASSFKIFMNKFLQQVESTLTIDKKAIYIDNNDWFLNPQKLIINDIEMDQYFHKVKEHQNINCMTGNLNKQNGDDNKQQTD
ncbi:MAG: hypothetical protein ACLVEE_18555 [Phocaeicola vulgatus]